MHHAKPTARIPGETPDEDPEADAVETHAALDEADRLAEMLSPRNMKCRGARVLGYSPNPHAAVSCHPFEYERET